MRKLFLCVLVLSVAARVALAAPDANNNIKKSNAVKALEMVRDTFQIGADLRAFNSWDTSSQPIGFATTSSDEVGISGQISLQAKFRKFGLEYDFRLGKDRTLDTQFYGASLGGIKVNTNHALIWKFFPIDLPDWAASVGFGAEHTELSGAVSMGGFKFHTTGNGWSPVLQIGGWYHLTDWMSLRANYERVNVRIVTEIPGVPNLNSTNESRFILGLMFGWHKFGSS